MPQNPRAKSVVESLLQGILFWCVAFPGPAVAAFDPGVAGLCDRAARQAAQVHDVPLDVLRAITRVETGRSNGGTLEPWPWTVNMEGTGHWFPSQAAAQRFVFDRFKSGARSFDVGCFQINYRWHSQAFRSIEDMFDPETNADYAARFLRELHNELGSWSAAAGAFHSRTQSLADGYAARFERTRARLEDMQLPPPPGPLSTARAQPLIAFRDAANGSRPGSLVVTGSSDRPFIPFN